MLSEYIENRPTAAPIAEVIPNEDYNEVDPNLNLEREVESHSASSVISAISVRS